MKYNIYVLRNPNYIEGFNLQLSSPYHYYSATPEVETLKPSECDIECSDESIVVDVYTIDTNLFLWDHGKYIYIEQKLNTMTSENSIVKAKLTWPRPLTHIKVGDIVSSTHTVSVLGCKQDSSSTIKHFDVLCMDGAVVNPADYCVASKLQVLVIDCSPGSVEELDEQLTYLSMREGSGVLNNVNHIYCNCNGALASLSRNFDLANLRTVTATRDPIYSEHSPMFSVREYSERFSGVKFRDERVDGRVVDYVWTNELRAEPRELPFYLIYDTSRGRYTSTLLDYSKLTTEGPLRHYYTMSNDRDGLQVEVILNPIRAASNKSKYNSTTPEEI